MIGQRAGLASLFLLACAGLAGCANDDPAAIADLEGLDEGWNVIDGGDATACSDGSDYRFLARPGASDKLLLYFQGGGACWTGATCDPDLEPTYSVNLDALAPERAHGIFAFDEPANPFADYSVVVAPYCTGDVHLGDRVAVYEAPAMQGHASHEVTVNHNGMVNATAVLEWTFERFFEPSTVFVTGSSAGSVPSPYFAMLAAERYPDARIAQLGDASSGYRRELMTATPEVEWGTLDVLAALPEFAGLEPGELAFQDFYNVAAARHPRIRFAAFDHAEDGVQKQFLALAGHRTNSLLDVILANQADIRASVANFRSFIAGGDMHTILLRPEFYTQHVDGTAVRDWVADLAGHRPVQDRRCRDCAAGEFR